MNIFRNIVFFSTVAAGLASICGQAAAGQEIVSVQLNKATSLAGHCRITIVAHNKGATDIAKLTLDVVVFDKDGGVAGYSGIDLGRLQRAKTRVRRYDLPGAGCENISRLLVNDVRHCGALDRQTTCLQALKLTTRTNIEFGL